SANSYPLLTRILNNIYKTPVSNNSTFYLDLNASRGPEQFVDRSITSRLVS
ncbi:hypothetical protein C922_05310, partial [Plasmodium inui San Antonio 1]